jgi:hypothetical protein
MKEDVKCLCISCQEVSRLGKILFPGLAYSEPDLLLFIHSLGQEGLFPEPSSMPSPGCTCCF